MNRLWIKMQDVIDVIAFSTEIVDTATDVMEKFEFTEYMPSQLALDLLALVGSLTVAILEEAMTLEKQEEQTCILFCKIVEHGGILDTTVREEFQSGAETETDAAILFQKAVLFAMSGSEIRKYYMLGLNDCDNDWSILCEDCSEDVWTYLYDFTTGDLHGWNILNSLGHTAAGGIVHDNRKPSACWYRGIRLQLDFNQPALVTSLYIDFNATHGIADCNPSDGKQSEFRNPANSAIINKINVGSGDQAHAWSGSEMLDGIRIFAHSDSRGTAGQLQGAYLIRSITISGTGADPFA